MAYIIPFLLIVVPGILFSSIDNFGWIVPSLIFDIILISLAVRIVGPNTVKTVEFFGKYNRILRPGLNFIIPIFETTKEQTLYRINFPVEVEGITSDNVTAYIGLNVIYYVEDDRDDTYTGAIYRSIYTINSPQTMIRSTIDEQLRAMIFSFSHKEIFGKREEIGESIEQRLREKLSQFGYKLDSIQVRDVKLEASVMAAMNREIETEKLKVAAMNQAESQKIMKVKEAEAEKESKILLGEGMAGQRMKIAEGFKESVDMIKLSDASLNAKDILKFLLDSSRIETLGNIGTHNNSKLIYLNEDLEGRSRREEKLIAGSEIMGA